MPTPQPRRTVRAALCAIAAATGLALAAAPAAAQDGTGSSDGLWRAVQAGDCIIILYTEHHPLFGPRRTNRVARWNGACDADGLAHGTGVFAAETRVSPFEGAVYDERFEYRVTFQHGLIDGPGQIAEYNTRRTPGLTLAAVPRRATNPSGVFHRAGCEYFVSENGKIDSKPFWGKCSAAAGAALRDRARAAAEMARGASRRPPPTPPAGTADATLPVAAGSAGGGSANTMVGGAGGGAATPVTSDGIVDPARRRLLHNPAASAMGCASLNRHPNGRNSIVNGCGVPIEAFWCSVTSGECDRGAGNSWTIGIGTSWPLGSGDYRWAACLGRDSGRFDKDSQGTRFICPALDPPR